MANCESCGKEIQEGYKLCFACNIKNKQANNNEEVIKIIQQVNWNLGTMALMNKIQVFYILESSNWNKEQSPELKQIYDYLKGDIGKYINSLNNIRKEQGGNSGNED